MEEETNQRMPNRHPEVRARAAREPRRMRLPGPFILRGSRLADRTVPSRGWMPLAPQDDGLMKAQEHRHARKA
jgi:hypothetical protein